MDKQVKLKPCPFCGGKAKINKCTMELPFSEERNAFSVFCTECGCSPFEFDEINLYYNYDWKEREDKLKNQAIEAWNRRVNNG